MDESITTVDLGIQLAVAAALVLLMTVIHSLGLLGISTALRLNDERLREHAFNLRAVLLVGSMGLLLFALHIFEIFIFAGFYMMVSGMQTLEEALYTSASSYATLGWNADFFPTEWRLIGALESLVGFILIGWSTAFMVSTMKKLTD